MPLKWHYPLGLLYDLYSGAEPAQHKPAEGHDGHQDETVAESKLPWRLTIHYSDFPNKQLVQLDANGKVLNDLFMNNVKEVRLFSYPLPRAPFSTSQITRRSFLLTYIQADFLRNGNGKTILSLSKDQTEQLWTSVQTHNHALFNPINTKLQNPPGVPLKHIPIRLYLPHAADVSSLNPNLFNVEEENLDPKQRDKVAKENADLHPGFLRVIQRNIVPKAGREAMTIGTMLNQVVPSVFPSRRTATIAMPVLHGAVVPMQTSVEELMRSGVTYADGWLHIGIVMMG